MVVVLHNSRCSKSRETLKLLEEIGVEFEIRKYLEEPLSKAEIENLLLKLECSIDDIIRKNEDVYKQLVLENGKPSSSDLFDWVVRNPILLQRPIVVVGDKARIGRPPELVLELLD